MANTGKLSIKDLVDVNNTLLTEKDLEIVRSVVRGTSLSRLDIAHAGLLLIGEQIGAAGANVETELGNVASGVCSLLRVYVARAAQEAEEARGAAEELAGLTDGWLAAVEAAPSAEEALRTAVAGEKSDREAVRLARERFDRASEDAALSVRTARKLLKMLERASCELRELCAKADAAVAEADRQQWGTERYATLDVHGDVEGYYASQAAALDDLLGEGYMEGLRAGLRAGLRSSFEDEGDYLDHIDETVEFRVPDDEGVRNVLDSLVPIQDLAAKVKVSATSPTGEADDLDDEVPF